MQTVLFGVQGLAYSVSGGWNTTPADHVGLFVAGGETAKPVEFLAALQRVLQVCMVPLITMPASRGSASRSFSDCQGTSSEMGNTYC